MEATKWLKPSISVSRIGGSASVQAATRVNAEQALYGAFSVNADFDRAPVIPKKRRHQLLARGAGEQNRKPWHADADC